MITKDCNVTNQNVFCKVLLCKCNMFDKNMWYINYGQKQNIKFKEFQQIRQKIYRKYILLEIKFGGFILL